MFIKVIVGLLVAIVILFSFGVYKIYELDRWTRCNLPPVTEIPAACFGGSK